jgi:hypothetical protein
MPDQSTKLKAILEIVKDSVGKEEFEKNFRIIIDLIKALKVSNAQEMKSLDGKYASIVSSIKDNATSDLKNIKQEAMDFLTQEVRKLISEHRSKLNEIDNKIAQIRDGKDADEEIVAQNASKMAITAILDKVVAKDDFKGEVSKLGDLIADTISGLLEIKDIKNLQEILDELRQLKGKTLGGGGFNYSALLMHQVNEEVPVNSGDDLNFTINYVPSPTASLKVYRNGQRLHLTDDFTFSGKTITLLNALTAGEIFFVDYQN